jgi:hypothetical protein
MEGRGGYKVQYVLEPLDVSVTGDIVLQRSDLVVGECEDVVQLDGTTWKVACQASAEPNSLMMSDPFQ